MMKMTDKKTKENAGSQTTREAKVLLVEDHEDIAYGLKNNLEFENYGVEIAGTGAEGLQLMNRSNIDIIILDLMLPGMSGYEFLETIRNEGFRVPVLILSAKGEEVDKVRGFRLGADDYVTKPFGTMELMARVEAILRRSGDNKELNGYWKFGDIEVNVDKRIVRKNGRQLNMTPLQFELLHALLRRNGAVAKRIELLDEVWNKPEDVVTRTVDTHIAELRNKLEDTPSEPDYIITVPKVGYKLKT